MPIFTITSNAAIARDVYKLTLAGDCSAVTKPGQFVNISLPGRYLRRPISVCDCDRDSGILTLIYKTVGEGTRELVAMKSGEQLDILTGLGNGFDISVPFKNPVLIGGGVGVPPLYWLAKELLAAGIRPAVIMGFASAPDVFYTGEFRVLGLEVIVTTADGSAVPGGAGTRGFVTDALRGADYDYFFACGPEPMLHALCGQTKTDGQLSFEERMACGFGACMCCSRKTADGGYKRICRDGPVLRKREVVGAGREE